MNNYCDLRVVSERDRSKPFVTSDVQRKLVFFQESQEADHFRLHLQSTGVEGYSVGTSDKGFSCTSESSGTSEVSMTTRFGAVWSFLRKVSTSYLTIPLAAFST